MPSRQDVLSQLGDGGYESAGRRLGIPAGKAYMIATGLPADGSDSLAPEDHDREGIELGGTQALLGVPHHNPAERTEVLAWVRERARRDQQMQAAARRPE